MKIEIDGMTPTDQQKQMIYGIMTRQMSCVHGGFGSGKTTAIRFLKKILGDRLLVLAPTHLTCFIMGPDAEAITIDTYLRARKREKFKNVEYIVVDESSQATYKQYDGLVKLVEKTNVERRKLDLVDQYLTFVGNPYGLPPEDLSDRL